MSMTNDQGPGQVWSSKTFEGKASEKGRRGRVDATEHNAKHESHKVGAGVVCIFCVVARFSPCYLLGMEFLSSRKLHL
jgi:hypothetical protein